MTRLRRETLIALVLLTAFVGLGFYFGWLSQAPPLLAPGIQ